MLKKMFSQVSSGLVLAALVFASEAFAKTESRVTMLVVPARYSVIQLSFDIVRKYPVVLVSYQGDATTERPVIQAWNGREWVPIAVEDYRDGNFLRNAPQKAIMVGDDTLLPPVLADILSWCPVIDRVGSFDTAALVNRFGKSFGFSHYEWEWFAKRYNLTIEDRNAGLRRASWYDQPNYIEPVSRKKGRNKPAPVDDVPAAEVVTSPVVALQPRPASTPAESAAAVPLPSESVRSRKPDPEPAEAIAPPSLSTRPAPSAVPPGWQEKAIATDPSAWPR